MGFKDFMAYGKKKMNGIRCSRGGQKYEELLNLEADGGGKMILLFLRMVGSIKSVLIVNKS